MYIAILSRNKKLYSIQRLLKEARLAHIKCDVIDPLSCQLVINHSQAQILFQNKILPIYDAVIPRIGASITDFGLSVVKHFEAQGIPLLNGSLAIGESRNKMRSLQSLTAARIPVPATVLTRNAEGLRQALQTVNGLPVVLKILKGSHGVGVMLVHTPVSLDSVLDTLRTLNQDVIIQQFIVEGSGSDYRVLVVGDRVIAAMTRTAQEGEFRSNIHRGAQASNVELPKLYEQTALKAAKVFGLQVAGVDLMESHQGPLVIEVNSSPGLEGIEKATGINVAREIILQTKVLQTKKRLKK